MFSLPSINRTAILLAAFAGFFRVCAEAPAATFAVGTMSGRIFVGDVTRIDDSQLWLQTEKAGISIERPIAWNNIVLAKDSAREFTAKQLRAELARKPREVSFQIDNPFADGSTPPSIEPIRIVQIGTRGFPPTDSELGHFIESARSLNSQVCSISIDAYVGHWYRSVEANGIVLHLTPLDGAGAMVPVDGTLDVELVAGVPYGSRLGVPLPVIARWTVRVTPDLFGPAGAVFKLPFQAVHPEFDLNVGPRGVVHATLNVPGNGSFEASDSMVRIRPYSEVRDQSQQLTGRRFFSNERVQRWGR